MRAGRRLVLEDREAATESTRPYPPLDLGNDLGPVPRKSKTLAGVTFLRARDDLGGPLVRVRRLINLPRLGTDVSRCNEGGGEEERNGA